MNRAELDYYGVLNILRSATQVEITLAYRKLAIRLCPFRDPKHEREFAPTAALDCGMTHMSPLSFGRQWEYINMAYDVLGNEVNRAVYDRYGEAGLFEGVLLPNGYYPPYQYHGDHMKVYHEVFGSYSPYANIMDAITNPPVLYSTAEHGIGVRTRDAPVEKVINLDLEEIRFGSVKLMHVWRQEFVDKQQTRTEKRKKTLSLKIDPGTTSGTRYCFKEEGDRCPTAIAADIIFITADKPHPTFERRNHHDLVYKYKIDLSQALIGFRFTVDTLDKRKLKVSITDVVYPGFKKVLPGEGLPKCDIQETVPRLKAAKTKPKEFGDLIVEFEVTFPKYLNRDMKLRCRDFFIELKAMEEAALKNTNPVADFITRIRKR